MNPWIIALAVTTLNYLVVIACLLWLLLDERKQRQVAADKWAKILNEISEQFASDLQSVLGIRTGKPAEKETPDAIYIPREPDAEEVATRAVSEHVMSVGMNRLREDYRAVGITKDEDELRAEVQAIAEGRVPESWR